MRLFETVDEREAGRATLRLVEGGGHGGESFDPVADETIAFLEAAVK